VNSVLMMICGSDCAGRLECSVCVCVPVWIGLCVDLVAVLGMLENCFFCRLLVKFGVDFACVIVPGYAFLCPLF